MLELRKASGRLHLRLRALRMGADICLLLDGGDRPHIGAAALCSPGGNNTPSALGLPGHREAELAEALSRDLSTALGATVAVICGIHLDNITRDEIHLALRLAHELAHELVMNWPTPCPTP